MSLTKQEQSIYEEKGGLHLCIGKKTLMPDKVILYFKKNKQKRLSNNDIKN